MKYVDVNVLVYWLADDPQFGQRATDIVKRIENGEAAATSTLTIWLTHVVLSSLAVRYSTQEMLNRLTELAFLKTEPLLQDDFTQATAHMAQYGLDLEDSLHFATALRLGITEIYTFDTDFTRTPLRVVSR